MSDTETQKNTTNPADTAPRVWLLAGHKAGDNNQLLALAGALGWPYQIKSMVYRRYELLTNRLLGVTLLGIERHKSSPLEPPWPDLIITAGRRNEPVARWVQRQSGGSTRLVHIGRPWAALDSFDLIVTTPQYFLPERSNILHNRLPLHRINAERLRDAARSWAPRFFGLPRPWIGILVGGDSGAFAFTSVRGAELGRRVNRLAGKLGGSVLSSDSARTSPAAGDAFVDAIDVPHFCYRWGDGGDNPYQGLLGSADLLVVTGESMSMLAEAAATGKPLYIFDFSEPSRGWWRHRYNWRFKAVSHRLAMRFGPTRMRRDIGNIQRALVADGCAAWLDDHTAAARYNTVDVDLESATARVRTLLAHWQ